MRAAHASAHGSGDDNDENDNGDAYLAFPRPVPRHPFGDGLVLDVRPWRFFTAGHAHSSGAVVKDASVLVRCGAGGRGRGCARILASLQ